MIGKKIVLSTMLANAIHFAGGIGASLGFRNQREINIKKSEKEHLQDLQDRLQEHCSYATPKGYRKPIGSTMPYQEKVKRKAKRLVAEAQNSIKKQFAGDIMADGRHRLYQKDGQWIERTSSI